MSQTDTIKQTSDNKSFSDELLGLIDKAGSDEQVYQRSSIEKQCSQKLADAKAEGDRRYDDMVKAAKQRMDATQGGDIAKRKRETKTNASKKRDEIKKNIFDKVEKKLADFVKSPEYDTYLEKTADKIKTICGDEKTIIFLASFDEDKSSIFASRGFDTKTDKQIKLGSVYAVCEQKRIRLDDTFDTKLEKQAESFTIESGLVIDK